MTNKTIGEIFYNMGTILEMKGENIFKIKAYYKAAENIFALQEDLAEIRKTQRLCEIPGIGKTLEEKINEYLDTGKISAYEALIREVPLSVLDFVNIPSVGPKKAKLIFENLGIKSVEELLKAAEDGSLLTLPKMKKKTIENIIRGIKLFSSGQQRMNIGAASRTAEQFIAALSKLPEVKQIAVAGSLRRMQETIRDIDILIDSSKPEKVMEVFCNLPLVKTINAQGETKSSILTYESVQVDLRVVEPGNFGAGLLYFTGSKNFNIKLRQIAIKKDMKISEYGVFSVKGDKEKFLAGKTEEECFKALGLKFVPPELREDFGEAEIFSGAPLPKLLELKQMKGDLHVHSTYSDGQNTIAEMVDAARAIGYEYLAICDHSERLKIAGGLTASDLKKKKKEIDELNGKLKGFRVLFGTEVEIDTEGNLDYNDSILGAFDMVIASIHSGFEQPSEKLTQRLIKVCQNPYVHGIGHPTGRHIGKREPYAFDLKEVCRVAVETNTFLEINAFPQRLDLDSGNTYFARSQDVKFTINTDSHSVKHLEYMKFGVGVARRGWLSASEVLNTLPVDLLLKAIKNKK